MPDGVAHENFRKLGYLVIIPTGLFLINNPVFLLGRYIGYTAGRYIVPDWDIMGVSNDEGNSVNELGILGIPLYGISAMYGAVFRKFHRSFWTHFPFVSTIPRVLLVFSVPIGLLYWFKLLTFNFIQLEFYAGFIYGLSESDFVHWLADKLWPDGGQALKDKREKLEKKIKGKPNGKKNSKGRPTVAGRRPQKSVQSKSNRRI